MSFLDASEGALLDRIASDEVEPTAGEWRGDHVSQFVAARSWMVESAEQ